MNKSGKNGPVTKAGGINIAKKTIKLKKKFLDFEIIEHIYCKFVVGCDL